jgi:ClpP class serine protease
VILASKPWMITPSGALRIEREEEKRKALKSGAAAIDLVAESPREMSMLDDKGIAHIHVSGVIGHRLDWFDKFCGNTDVCDLRRELDNAVMAGANGIFLRIDSPGGGITGGAEVADYLAEISAKIPVFAWSDACCASMAFWIACGASQIWTSETAEIGSVGIYLPWIDKSAAWQAMGLEFKPFTNSGAIYKSAGHGPSLTPEQEEQMQGFIDRIASLFQGFVTSRRPQLMAEAMQGQAFLGCDAPLYGLSDSVGTIEQAYSALCLEAGVFPMDMPLDHYLPISYEFGQPLAEVVQIPKVN